MKSKIFLPPLRAPCCDFKKPGQIHFQRTHHFPNQLSSVHKTFKISYPWHPNHLRRQHRLLPLASHPPHPVSTPYSPSHHTPPSCRPCHSSSSEIPPARST